MFDKLSVTNEELKNCLYSQNNNQEISAWYSRIDYEDDLLGFSKWMLDSYYEGLDNELKALEYLPLDMKEADLLFDAIDCYNEDKDPNLTISDLLIPENYKKFESYVKLNQSDNAETILKAFENLNKEANKNVVSKIDKLIKEHSDDGIKGYVPHTCLYQNIVKRFLDGVNPTINDFYNFIKIGIVPMNEVRKVIKERLGLEVNNINDIKQLFFGNEDKSIVGLTDQKNNLNRAQSLLVTDLIKLHRKSNLEKKRYHTMRTMLLTYRNIEKMQCSEFLKQLLLISALFHDIGRFYHAVYYDEFLEDFMKNVEGEYNYIDGDSERLAFDHATVGYYYAMDVMMNFIKDDDAKFKGVLKKFKQIAPLLATVIKIHGKTNWFASYLDERFNSRFIHEKNMNFEDFISIIDGGMDEVYRLCETSQVPTKRTVIHPTYNTMSDEKDFLIYLNKNRKLDLLNLISECINNKNYNTLDGESFNMEMLQQVIDVVSNNNACEYDFACKLLEILERKASFLDGKGSLDEKAELDLKKLEDDFCGISSIMSLSLMDIDKIDILVQYASGWLDNDLKQDNILMKIPVGDGRVIEKDGVVYINLGIQLDDEKYSEFNRVLSENYNFITLTRDGVLSFPKSKEDAFTISLGNRAYYKLIVPVDALRRNCDVSSYEESKEQEDFQLYTNIKAVALPEDIIKYYMCLSNEQENNTTMHYNKDNVFAKLYWRIDEFIMKNMRLKSSFKTLQEINVLEELYNYIGSFDSEFQQFAKPIIYVAKKYIDYAVDYAETNNKDIITKNDTKEIKKKVGEHIRALYSAKYPHEEIDTNKLFEIIIKESDEPNLPESKKITQV